MKKKKIRIKFTDWWDGFDIYDNFITKELNRVYELEYSDHPEYLFYSCMGTDYVEYDCVRVFFTGENVRPDFNLCDYALGFDYIEFEDRYLRYPLFLADHYRQELTKILEHDKSLRGTDSRVSKSDTASDSSNSALQYRDKFCAYLASHCPEGCPREKFVLELSKYKSVECGGKSLNNIGHFIDNKHEWQKNFKFSVCFENTKTNGYTTEKIMQGFASGTIPIYWGNKRVIEDFNPKAFINCNDFESLDDVIQRVQEIDQNEALWNLMYNEAIFTDKAYETYLSPDYLFNFLCNIIDQPYENSRRINRGYYWGKNCDDNIKRLALYKKIFYNSLLRRIIRFVFRIDIF